MSTLWSILLFLVALNIQGPVQAKALNFGITDFKQYIWSNMVVIPTKEAVDDAEQAAHGADHGGYYLIPTSRSQIARIQWLWTNFSWRRSQFEGQRLESGRHGDQGVTGAKRTTNGRIQGREWVREGEGLWD